MDFTISGVSRFEGGLENRDATWYSSGGAALPDAGRTASYFSELPNENGVSDPNGPILLMPPPKTAKRRGVRAQRIWLVVFVLFCLEVGIILMWCPWTKVWSENSILVSFPRVQAVLMSGFVRGVISGLGLVNIWMGIAEAVRYRESHD
jgi:hypothetical protein